MVGTSSRRQEHDKQELKYQKHQDTCRQVSSSVYDVIILDTLILCNQNQKIGREGESMGSHCFCFPEAPTQEREREKERKRKKKQKEREREREGEKRVTADVD